MGGGSDSKWVPIRIHSKFVGGLDRVAEQSGWRVRRTSGVDEVCLEERYSGTNPALLLPVRIGQAAALDRVDYERFRRWYPLADHPDLWSMANERARRVTRSGDVDGFLEAFQLLAMTAPEDQVADLVKGAFENLAGAFKNASLWVVETTDRLKMRMAGANALFASEETPEVLSREPFGGFPAARGLQGSLILGFEPLVEPVLVASAPFLHGVMSTRAGGSIIMLFGEPVFGLHESRHPVELYKANALYKASPEEPEGPDLLPDALEGALQWWVNRMNYLLAVLLDPSRYRGIDGVFDPRPYFTASLNFERLFACLQTILLYSHRDDFVRMSLFFDALDLLEGLGLGDYRETVRLPRVEARLERLAETLPEAPAALFLPRCHKALDALREARDGFYLHERRSGDNIRMKMDSGHWQDVPVDTALADYLRVVRNAQHTFRTIARDARRVSLLAAHGGDLPLSLADLPLIHVLTLLVNPELLRP
jgi:hypothetical protein